ncbi:type II secretion system F family protein [Candidatus Woesearchaeota archaeon]|nr:type II secretion system F family protein [Candidatus Woesearchaeota archaeon]
MMEWHFDKKHLIGVILGVALLAVDLLFLRKTSWFIPLLIISLSIGWMQFWLDFFMFSKKQKELESMFPEFVRNLVGSIKSGMPVSKAIIYVAKSDYGALTPHIVKLANQVEWAIPVHKALGTFANETNNGVIKRSISTVIEAELSGGNMEDVLETVTKSVIEIKKIKLARKAGIHSQLVQSYIIFIVFLGVMIVIQNLLIPYIANIESKNIDGIGEGGMALTSSALGGAIRPVKVDFSSLGAFIGTAGAWFTSIRGVFLMLAMIQACFAGLVLGKLAEGDLKSGAKHSLILMTVAFFVITLAQGVMS